MATLDVKEAWEVSLAGQPWDREGGQNRIAWRSSCLQHRTPCVFMAGSSAASSGLTSKLLLSLSGRVGPKRAPPK